MKKRSKFLLLAFNVALLGALAAAIVHLVYAPATMSLELTSNMEEIASGDVRELRFVVYDTEGEVEMDFERVHEKLMHLIVVREDLASFQHLHPDFDKETGEFSVNVSFSSPGPYHLFADFAPENSTQTVLSFSLDVVGDYEAEPLTLDSAESFVLDGLTVTPSFPEGIQTGEAVSYSFEVKSGEDAVNLEDYLGAKGHSVILKEGDLDYLHTHPEDDSLSFETFFDQAGTYKSFTQFQVEGRLYTIPYVFEVTAGGESSDEEDGMEMDHSEH